MALLDKLQKKKYIEIVSIIYMINQLNNTILPRHKRKLLFLSLTRFIYTFFFCYK